MTRDSSSFPMAQTRKNLPNKTKIEDQNISARLRNN
jgi:hypothetical protein